MLLFSCNRNSIQNEIKSVLDKKLYFGQLENKILHGNNVCVLSDILLEYEYMYVVYLEDSCKPCYPKFVEWHNKFVDITIPDNFTVLFVIQGNNYDFFMQQVRAIQDVDSHFYVIMDPYSEFIGVNSKIPRWVIDASMLIESGNRIKLVGPPWMNNDMEDMFLKIVNRTIAK
jgi:hypothetical protein